MREKEQLADYIIVLYNVIDYDSAIQYFGTYDNMLTALHSNTGDEYDINEVIIGKSDAHYAEMISASIRHLHLKDIHDVLALNADEKMSLFHWLSGKTEAIPEQIAAFLRMRLQKRRYSGGVQVH